ncbi:AsmA family protein [Halomonas cibimaris]|uniref:AsmA family protein n=1 Tax=Halomonas cibimaris TaxID=657012 RepID=A0ABP7LPH2_9GAMM
MRIVLAAVGILGMLAVASVVYVTTFMDPEDFKPRLTAVVEEQTGLDIELDGALAWSFYPRIGVSVEKARAWLDEQDKDTPPFAGVERAEVSVAFAPLLRGEIAVDGLTLDGLRLNLRRNEQGEGNWEPLVQRMAERGEKAEAVLAPASAGPGADAASLDVALSIASVKVNNADLRFRDARHGTLWHVDKLNVTGSNVNPQRSFPLKAALTLSRYESLDAQAMTHPPAASSEIELDTRLTLAPAEHGFVLESPRLATRTRLVPDAEPQALRLEASRIEASLDHQRLVVTDGALKGTLHHPDGWKGGLALALTFAFDGDWGEQVATVNDMRLTGPDELRARGRLTLENWRDALRYDGQLTLKPLSLRPWLKRLGVTPNIRDPDAFSDVSLTSQIDGDAERIRLAPLSLVVDNTTLTGALAADLDGTALDVDLEGDTLNADRYLPAAAAQQAGIEPVRRALAQNAPPALLPQPLLASLALDGRLALGTLTLGGLTFDTPRVALQGRDGSHRLKTLEAGFYGGKLSATGRLDAGQVPLEWALAPRVEGVKLAPLLKTLNEGDARLSGRLDAGGAFTTQGNTREDLLRRLNGKGQAELNDGVIAGVNVSRQLCEAVAAVQERETTRDWNANTRFERADATFTVRDGVVQSDDVLITLPGIDVHGEGQYDPGHRQFDVLASIRLVDTADAACKVNPRLAKLALPVRCEGSLGAEPGDWCRVDQDTLADSVSRLVGDEVGSRIEEKLDEKLGEGAAQELRDGLKRLFD